MSAWNTSLPGATQQFLRLGTFRKPPVVLGLCLWMLMSFLRESFFNIHLQVTNKGIVPPFGLSPAI